jgi:acyl-CoA thioesterase
MTRAELIWAGDRLAQEFGMELLEAEEGRCRVAVLVQERFLNAHGIGHGALIFAVADVAFALAVNSITDAVGVQWSLNIFRPARAGERLIAQAQLIHRGRQLLVCELTVSGPEGRLIARGQATALPAPREGSSSCPQG